MSQVIILFDTLAHFAQREDYNNCSDGVFMCNIMSLVQAFRYIN